MRGRNRTLRHGQALRRIANGTSPSSVRRAGNRIRKMLNVSLRGKAPTAKVRRRIQMTRLVNAEAKADSLDAIKATSHFPPKKKGIASRMLGGAKRLFGMNRARGG